MISQSQINCYINCSKKYYYRYIKCETPSNETKIDGLLIGKVVHKYIDNYLKKTPLNVEGVFYSEIPESYFLNNYKMCQENYVEYMKNNLLEKYHYLVFETKEVLKTKTNVYLSLLDLCKKIANFIVSEIENGLLNEFIDIETEKEIVYDDIHGFCDIIAITKNLETVIVDFKTSKSDYKFKKSVQDLLYSYIIYKTTGEMPKFLYIAIKYGEKIDSDIVITKEIFEYNLQDFEKIEDYLQAFKKGIANNVFIRNENSFLCSKDFCEYFNICRGVENEI